MKAEPLYPRRDLLKCACMQCGGSDPLRRAEARVRLGAARTDLGVLAGSHGAGHRVAGAGAALEGLLRDHLLQRVLLLYLEDVWLLSLVLADAERKEGRTWCFRESPPESNTVLLTKAQSGKEKQKTCAEVKLECNFISSAGQQI